MAGSKMRVLILEDITADAELAKKELKKTFKDLVVKVVDTEKDYLKALEKFKPDLIIADYKLPSFDGLSAVKIKQKISPLTPFVILTESQNEEIAVDCLKAGADDYVIKEHMKRFGPAVLNAIMKKKSEINQIKFEQELLESQKNLNNAQKIGKLGFWDWNIVTGDLNWSDNTFIIYGFKPKEFVPSFKIFEKILHPEDVERVKLNVEAALKGDSLYNLDFRFIRPKGEIGWIHCEGEVTFDENGKAIRFFGTQIDISRYKIIEETLKENELKIRLLADHTYDWEYLIAPDGNYIYISPSCKRVSGYSPEEFISDPELMFRIVRSDFSKKIRSHFKDKHIKDAPGFAMEFPIINKSGEEIWIEHHCNPVFDNEGKFRGSRGNNRDITERRNANNNLKESEAHYRYLFDSLPYGGEVLDLKGNITDCSPQTALMLGYTKEEMIGKHITDFLAEDVIENFKEEYPRILKGECVKVEIKMVHKNGSQLFIHRAARPIYKGEKEIMGVLALNVEITERKQAEEALRRSEFEFRILSDLTFEGILIHDNGIAIDFNLSLANMFGYQREELIGKNLIKLFIPEEFHTTIADNIKKDNASPYEAEGKRKDGSVFPIEIEARNIVLEGKRLTRVTAIRDITERKKVETVLKSSEERLKIIFELAPDAIYINDLKGNFLDGNKAAEKLIGYKKEELIGKNFSKLDILSKNDLPRAFITLAKNALGKRTGPDEFLMNRKDGSQILLEVSNFPVKIQGKSVVLGIARDISERKRSEEELKLTQASVDNLTDAVYWMGADAKFIYVNNAAIDVLGYSRKELLNMTVHDISPEFPEEVWPAHWKKLKNKGSFLFQTIHKRKNGSIFPVEITVNLLQFEEKEINCAIAKDITERKQAEETLRESEAQLRNIFENSTSLYYSHTPDHILTYLSPQVEEVLGYTIEEALVKWTELATENPVNDRGFQHTVRAIETCRQQPPYELELVRKDGRKINVEVRESPLVENGKTTAIIGSIVDITTRKAAEAEIMKLKNNLEIEVAEKTKELNEKVDHLQRFVDATVNRELRMKDLSDENEKLKAELEKKG